MVKVIFCMPGRTYSREFLLGWTDLIMQASARGHQCMVSQQYTSCVHFARAKCLGGDVLKGPDQKPFQGQVDYDVIMWIDSDMVFRPDDFFAMLESPHDVTAGLYMMESMQEFAVVKDWDTDYFAKHGSFKFLRPDDIVGASQYQKVAYSGMGWMMIRKGVVEDLKYPWFYGPLEVISEGAPRPDGSAAPLIVDMNSEDVSFCKALAAAGHPIYVDTKVRIGHQKSLVL
jgi:hypothetical protein